MEGNGMQGRMYSNTGVGMLGLEVQNSQHHLQKHPKIMAFSQQQQQHEQTSQIPTNNQPTTNYISSYPIQKTKTQITNSDEDDPCYGTELENNSFEKKRKSTMGSNSNTNMSPWQRMKWTDNMVRLLIMAVYYIGDEVAGNSNENITTSTTTVGFSDKSKNNSRATAVGGNGGGGGMLQKKGKWKSVSRAMMEKGFYVSPQQCEDKFNDLNKRYKRVNDILGKGTACKVVENQSLLEEMNISCKMKNEVRKLLNSKHLFFREMCAYHNSCGHTAVASAAGGGNGAADGVAAAATETAHTSQQHQQQQQQQQVSCLHSTSISPSYIEINSSHKLGLVSDDDEEEEDEDADDEFDDEEEDHEEGGLKKRVKTHSSISSNISQALQQLNGEIMGVLQNGSKSSMEKKQWVNTQMVQLEEQGLKFQLRTLELEKQRLKWLKFSSKKEREMEKMKIDNERKRLENERMMLLLRQKEVELMVDSQHHSNPSCIST